MVRPGARPLISSRTDVSSRTVSMPQPRAVSSTSAATAASSPLTDGVATRR